MEQNKNQFFGYTFKKKEKDQLTSFSPKEDYDGAAVVTAGGSYGVYVDLDSVLKNESDLVQKYRDMSMHQEIDHAIEEITNEIVDIENDEIVSIDFKDDDIITDNVKKLLTDEFEEAMRLLDMRSSAYEIVRRWYIDGRLKYHAIIDKNKTSEGLQELRYVDPRKIRKIREVQKSPVGTVQNSIDIVKTVNEYYVYSDRGFVGKNNTFGNATSTSGIKISKDSIIDIPSGLTDTSNSSVLSYLHKAIKPLNQLRTLEDASIIYTLARAPERRVWYIDTGSLPKAKAEQHMREIMNLHKNKLVYDGNTGEIKDDRKFMTMLEDYWLPRRGDDGRGTQVTTLQGGNLMGEMGQVEYFQKKLFASLNVPTGRLAEGDTYTLGRSTQITRDEVKFSKFVTRLRSKLNQLFIQVIEKNLFIKNVMSQEDWDKIKTNVRFKWASSSYFEELKEGEVLQDRINIANEVMPFVGDIVSREWLMKNVFRLSDEQILNLQKQIIKEKNIEMMSQIASNDQADDMGFSDDSQDNGAPKKGEEDKSDPVAEKKAKLARAKMIYDQLKMNTNRTPQEQQTYMIAAQTLGKNKTADKSNKINKK